MKNLELAMAFERIASLMEFLGESPFKVRAYRRAARTFLELDVPVEQLAQEGRLRALPGVGEAIEAKVLQYLSTGRIELLERLVQQVPETVVQLTEIPGVGPATARLVFEKLGIRTVDELEQAARQGRLREVKGLGPRSERAILQGIEQWRRRAGEYSIAYLLSAAEHLAAALQSQPAVARVGTAGSVRRGQAVGSDVDLVVESPTPGELARRLENLGRAEPGPWEGSLRVRGRGPAGVPLDVWVVPSGGFAVAFWLLTGPRAHVEAVRQRLHQSGIGLEGGRVCRDGEVLPVGSEEEIYRLAGLPWIPPELRWGEDELSLAVRGELPQRLVELADLRGDLHVHTLASDGTASAREMAEAARHRGLEYLAITDHSASLTVAGGLSPEQLHGHVQQLRALDRELAGEGEPGRATPGGRRGPRILAGAEVDVLPDGQLDYPDEVLEQLDVVIVSVHTHLRQGREEMTQRILAALEHPGVHILAHPTGRLVGRRPPYEVDLEAVMERAAQRGIALELNASPDRLDLDAAWARRARRLGVQLVLNTDAHAPAQLGYVRYGLLLARRAGLGPTDLLNTLPFEELRRWLRRRALRSV